MFDYLALSVNSLISCFVPFTLHLFDFDLENKKILPPIVGRILLLIRLIIDCLQKYVGLFKSIQGEAKPSLLWT
jgi:hypothetical protein